MYRWMMGFAFLAAAAACPQFISAQDAVADAARQARAQKKTPAKPAKVYTDDDLNRLPATGGTQGNAAGAPTQPKTDAAAQDQQKADASADDKSEAAWRKRFAAVRSGLAQAEKELDILQREGDRAQTQYYSDPQKAMNEQLTRKEINDKAAKIAAKQKEIGQIKQKISDMEDELRKSGGSPGWSR
jgi:hypothetical protein